MTKVAGCPRCGDQTLWNIARNRCGELHAWCRLCSHTWQIEEQNVFRCDDPEGDWIRDQEGSTA